MLRSADGLDGRDAQGNRCPRLRRTAGRCGMAVARALGAAGQAWRAAADGRYAGGARWGLPRAADRLPVAALAADVSAMADGVWIFSPPRRLRRLGRDAERVAHCRARGVGTRSQPIGGDHRQPEREDDRKRGPRGWDGGKKVKGRKRHILVDTLGLLLAVLVNPANTSDAAGAIELMARVRGVLVRLGIVYADGGYAYDSVANACRSVNNARLMVVKRTDPGFKVLPKRWIVERTLAWLGRNRRLSKDYEQLPHVSEAFVKMAMVRLMI